MDRQITWLPEEFEHPTTQAVRSEFIFLDTMKEPCLVTCAAHSHVETLLVHLSAQCRVLRVRGSDHTQEHHVAFVALERIRVATTQLPLAEHRRTKALDQQILNS